MSYGSCFVTSLHFGVTSVLPSGYMDLGIPYYMVVCSPLHQGNNNNNKKKTTKLKISLPNIVSGEHSGPGLWVLLHTTTKGAKLPKKEKKAGQAAATCNDVYASLLI